MLNVLPLFAPDTSSIDVKLTFMGSNDSRAKKLSPFSTLVSLHVISFARLWTSTSWILQYKLPLGLNTCPRKGQTVSPLLARTKRDHRLPTVRSRVKFSTSEGAP